MDTENLVQRIDELTALGNDALNAVRERGQAVIWLEYAPFYKFRTASISFILKLFGNKHPYYKEFSSNTTSTVETSIKIGIGILNAIRNEIENGWLNSTRSLISADIFGDFLEMAEHLLEENYKDPAAVIIGSALEQHLRHLAVSNGIDTTVQSKNRISNKKADTLNADLTKAGVYSKIDQKNVISWLGIRNDAAHGNYDNYNQDQVSHLLTAVTEFIGRVTAE